MLSPLATLRVSRAAAYMNALVFFVSSCLCGYRFKNLWVLARSPVLLLHGGESTRIYRPQRPGMIGNHGKSLQNFRHVQIQRILAMRGGSDGY